MVATNDNGTSPNDPGTSFGADQTFTTAPTPPAVVGGTATGLTSSSATLQATVNPSGLATNVYFNYGTTCAYGFTTAKQNVGSGTTPGQAGVSLSALSSGTIYHYQIVATNGLGSSFSSDWTFTTP